MSFGPSALALPRIVYGRLAGGALGGGEAVGANVGVPGGKGGWETHVSHAPASSNKQSAGSVTHARPEYAAETRGDPVQAGFFLPT